MLRFEDGQVTNRTRKSDLSFVFSESKRIEELHNELRRARTLKQFGEMLEHVRSQPGEPMSMEEIQEEVNAVRMERLQREGCR